jgi:hypothetical protein
MAPGARRHGAGRGSLGIVAEGRVVKIEYAALRHGRRTGRPHARSTPWEWPGRELPVTAEPAAITQVPDIGQPEASLEQVEYRRTMRAGGGR